LIATHELQLCRQKVRGRYQGVSTCPSKLEKLFLIAISKFISYMKNSDSGKSTDISQLHNIRTDYKKLELDESQVDQDPIKQFISWFNEALHSEVMEPNAMTLATASADGQPNARTVLLQHIDDRGFVFFT